MNKQMGKATPLGMAVAAIAIALVVVGALYAVQRLRPAGPAASVPQVQGVTETPGLQPVQPVTTAVQAPLPSTAAAGANGTCRATLLTIPWNATMGLMYANGGPETTANSLMDKQGVRVAIARQDDYGKMQEAQLKFAQDFKTNPCPSGGAAFVIIMGDGGSAYAAGISEQMQKIGQAVEVAGMIGFSYGEDACMLPYDVAKDPQKARGSLVGAVMRDGDYNICAVWSSQNGIPINPDEKSYDPAAMNFLAVDSFSQADEGYISGKCEDRTVVSAGKRTGETKRVCQNGTATWTPGDVNVAQKKGGLAKVASTREFSNQMPAVIIGNRDFMAKNPKIVHGLLAASFAGADQVRASDQALLFGGAVSAKVYGEQDAQYWAKYFKGVTETDRQGVAINLGGSRVANAADNAYYFGLSGGEDVYRRVYTMFGDHYVKYYPTVVASYPKYENFVNVSYLRSLIATSGASAVSAEVKPTFAANQKMERIVGERNWTIEFDSGKATFRPEAASVLNELLDQLIITDLAVEIRGHTDNVGGSESNVVLSRSRAEAVKQFLMANASQSFPAERVRTKGFGMTMPIADNNSAEGRAKNRRVEIILGTNSKQ